MEKDHPKTEPNQKQAAKFETARAIELQISTLHMETCKHLMVLERGLNDPIKYQSRINFAQKICLQPYNTAHSKPLQQHIKAPTPYLEFGLNEK